ncbi:unnamed protein product [Symbiodinium necroappetens]|uniref:Uncharacterized protein n=1 Tax=Symbiodinium necroappetens TaxID=1628268 RepID=A0A813A8E6_9DINO|nr:unnamed protein product [Symbiodinium necroappetens]
MAHILLQWRQGAWPSLQMRMQDVATGIETGHANMAEEATSSPEEVASVRCLAARASTSGPLTITAARCARLVVTRIGVTWTGTNTVVDSGVRRREPREDSLQPAPFRDAYGFREWGTTPAVVPVRKVKVQSIPYIAPTASNFFTCKVQPGQQGLQTTPSGTHGSGSGSSTDGPGATVSDPQPVAMVPAATFSQSLPTSSKPSVLIEIIDSDDDVRMESENQESLEAAVACELDKLD